MFLVCLVREHYSNGTDSCRKFWSKAFCCDFLQTRHLGSLRAILRLSKWNSIAWLWNPSEVLVCRTSRTQHAGATENFVQWPALSNSHVTPDTKPRQHEERCHTRISRNQVDLLQSWAKMFSRQLSLRRTDFQQNVRSVIFSCLWTCTFSDTTGISLECFMEPSAL